MVSRFVAGLAACALMVAPAAALAQAAPAPAAESIEAGDASLLRGGAGTKAVALSFVLILIALAIWHDDIFGSDDGELGGGTPVTP